MSSPEKFNPEQFSVPAAFPEILKDLNREVLRAQPKDIYQFCSTYFHKKLAEQRSKLINVAGGKPAEAVKSASVVPIDMDDETTAADFSKDVKKTKRQSVSKPGNQGMKSTNPSARAEDEQNLDNDSDYDDDEDDDDVGEPVPPPPPANNSHNRGRRTSVSAESMAPTTDSNYVKVVIPKSAEQTSRIQASIKNNFLFRSCDEEQYSDVVAAMAEKRVATGEEVIKQGGVGDFFYVVEIGTLDVFVSRNGAPMVKVTDYGPGGSFGELALMYNAPRAATVIASSDCVLWALDRVTFRRILMENTSRKRRMYEQFLEEVDLLSSLEVYERHKIADALESLQFNDGDVIIKQGDVGDNFYLLESGEVSITRTDEKGVVHQLPGIKKGGYFGELALLNNEPRKASIIAKGKVKVATLGKKAFVRLLGPVVNIIRRNAASNYNQVIGN